ncbi:hypothetical protein ACTHT5_11410 [Neisseria sp. P0022.S002]|uniref:hypothetical protein n=1 Tax=Neisseria sp. P0022.S002 TaxID=3436827 RepID=UPI003F7D01A5
MLWKWRGGVVLEGWGGWWGLFIRLWGRLKGGAVVCVGVGNLPERSGWLEVYWGGGVGVGGFGLLLCSQVAG